MRTSVTAFFLVTVAFAWPLRGSTGNDTFANATQLVTSNALLRGTNTLASAEPGEPAHSPAGALHSLWWRIQFGAHGFLTLRAEGSSFDHVIAVYTGATLQTLVSLGSTLGTAEACRVTVRPGAVYFIAIDSVTTGVTGSARVLCLYDQFFTHDYDLAVGWIRREPCIPFVWGSTDATREGWPAPGQLVTWRAFVKNWFSNAIPNVSYRWFLDGSNVASGTVTLAPKAYTELTYQWPWEFARHELTLFVDDENAIAEQSELNNRLTIYTDALSVGFWVERSLYNYFHQYQRNLAIGANGWEDWAQRHITRWNQMFERACYPETPSGVYDRVRLDQLHVVHDGALPLNGGLPSNNPDATNRTIDLQWGFNNQLQSMYSSISTVSDSNPFYFEDSLLHELGHARYLIDTYGFNYHSRPEWSNTLLTVHGALALDTPYLPRIGDDSVYRPDWYNEVGYGLMSGPKTLVDRYSAAALNLIAGRRATHGNMNSPGNIGVYLQDLPSKNVVTICDGYGRPLSNATVKIYQARSMPAWYGKTYLSTPDLVLTTDSDGRVNLGRCPFSSDGFITHTYGLSEGVAVVQVELGDHVGFDFLCAMEFNLAFWRGQTQTALYQVCVGLISTSTYGIAKIVPPDGYTLPRPLVQWPHVRVVLSGPQNAQSVTVNGLPATYSWGKWERQNLPLQRGTNTVTVIATWAGGISITQTVSYYRFDTRPPEIGREALLFPAPGTRLVPDEQVYVRWITLRLNDDGDDTSVTISRASVVELSSTQEVALIGQNLSNSGSRLWRVPSLPVDTPLAVRFIVRDSAGNAAERVFTDNPFTAVPEPLGVAALLVLVLACRRVEGWCAETHRAA
ncbi:MAG: hypothetical protein N2595_01235 [bacterium]|nr:hypothetical protein [bacterium]